MLSESNDIHTNCCIVGGGPAGMMLGLLLARNGIETVILEKHIDFLRDFRGDTIHPSTLEIMKQLNLLDGLLQRPHQIARELRGYINDQPITIADFSKLKVNCPYIAFMPQWDFLDYVASNAKQYNNFSLHMQTEAIDLLEEKGKIIGVKTKTPRGLQNIYANLVIGADGRQSLIRERAGLTVQDIGAPMDVFWFRLSRKNGDPKDTFGKFSSGKIFILINREEYWQCGYVIPKGTAAQYQQNRIEVFQQYIRENITFLSNRVAELKSWNDVKLLTVKIDRLKTWYREGLLCIGDAAHAMSPIGGVGINLAIQDAVATANIISEPLKLNKLSVQYLLAVQERRSFPMKIIQGLQQIVQKKIISNILKNKPLHIPWFFKKLQSLLVVRRIIGYLIGIGIRPEHVKISNSD